MPKRQPKITYTIAKPQIINGNSGFEIIPLSKANAAIKKWVKLATVIGRLYMPPIMLDLLIQLSMAKPKYKAPRICMRNTAYGSLQYQDTLRYYQN